MGMGEQEDYTTDIPEITDPIVEETEEWQTAEEEGFQRTNKKGEKVNIFFNHLKSVCVYIKG